MKTTGLKLDALKPNSIRDLKDYKQEIEEYLNKPKEQKMPALNQEKLLTNVLRTFNSSYPHNLLTGDTGIGKTVLSDFILKTFSSEQEYQKSMELVTLEQKKLFGTLKTKFQGMQNESHLYVPNFENPRVVEPITYTDHDKLEQDGFAFEDFGYAISEFMEDFSVKNVKLIQENTTGKKEKMKFKNKIVFDQFVSGIQELIKEFKPTLTKNSKLHEWTSQLITYIKNEKKEIEKGFLNAKIGIELFEESNFSRDIDDGNGNIKKEKVELEQFLEMSPGVLEKATSNNLDMSIVRSQIQFTLKFNEANFPPQLLFTPNTIENFPDSGIAKPVKIGSQGLAKAIGTITSCNQGDNGIYPPHTTVAELGPLFKGSIIYVKDGFKEYLQSTAFLDNGSKERFLTFLETGDLSFDVEGIEYKFHIPKMTLGSDNRDPFIRVEPSGEKYREVGLEARITEHQIPSYTKNNKQGRENTLDVITQRIDELNKETYSNISFDVETLEQLLKNTIIADSLLETKFRDLRKKIVDDIFQYANSNEIETVTVDTLKKIKLEQESPSFFTCIESETNSYEYKNLPEKSNGFVNGTAVVGEAGSVIGIKSNIVLGRGKAKPNERFKLVDLETGNGDQLTHKGFILASQYITNFLSQIEDKDLLDKHNWQTLTHFFKLYGGLGGDSASTAIASSIISELSDTPIYKNRYITGTLEPNGIVGQIGGIYEKSTGPYRIAELTNKPQHFIFPSANLEDLEEKLITDPYDIVNKVSLIPIDTFNQAFEILTNPNPTNEIIKNSEQLGQQTLNQAIINIEQKLKQNYKPTKSFFSFLNR
jgi:hypothetical protein